MNDQGKTSLGFMSHSSRRWSASSNDADHQRDTRSHRPQLEPECHAIVGVCGSEAVGHNLVDLIVPDDRRDELALFHETLREGRGPAFNESMRRTKTAALSPSKSTRLRYSIWRAVFQQFQCRSRSHRAAPSRDGDPLQRGQAEPRCRFRRIGLATIDYAADTVVLDETAAAMFGLPANTPIPRDTVHAQFHPDDAHPWRPQSRSPPSGQQRLPCNRASDRAADGSICRATARKQVGFSACRSDQGRRATTGSLALRDCLNASWKLRY